MPSCGLLGRGKLCYGRFAVDGRRIQRALRTQVLTMSNQSIFDLEGQTVLVTGGGRGLGKAMALGLANRGASVAVLGTNPETVEASVYEIEAQGVRSLAFVGDVTDEEGVTGTVGKVVDSGAGSTFLLTMRERLSWALPRR